MWFLVSIWPRDEWLLPPHLALQILFEPLLHSIPGSTFTAFSSILQWLESIINHLEITSFLISGIVLQIALSSWSTYSWGFGTSGWLTCDLRDCPLQKSLHVVQGMASLISWLYWSWRPFPGDNLCSVCRSRYLALAIGCCWSSIGFYGIKYLLGCLCSSCCISG